MAAIVRGRPYSAWAWPLAIGAWAAAMAAIPGSDSKLWLSLPVLFMASVWWTLARAERWIGVLFVALILLPPFPAGVGDTGAHLAPFIALIGMVSGLIRLNDWQFHRGGALPLILLVFTAVLVGSVGFAVFYSGLAVAAGSAARVLLFGIGVYVFLYTLGGPRQGGIDADALTKVLFLTASAGALFACIDFYYQLPAPAGFESQFIWLEEGVFRRAQGLFYEASTLGNFCVFFLVMILVTFFRPAEERALRRIWLAAGGVFFAGALVLSYSRASLINLLIAVVAFLCVRRVPIRRLLIPVAASLLICSVIARFVVPVFFTHYWERLAISFQFLLPTPDRVLSGRLAAWSTVGGLILQHPWQSLLGIGYKTLPYSNVYGEGIVADNTYLSLLAETGIAGLAVFLVLNAVILRAAWRAARSERPRASYYGSWIFCFWTGELAQMFSGDLITYWRVLPLYFWVLAMAARETPV